MRPRWTKLRTVRKFRPKSSDLNNLHDGQDMQERGDPEPMLHYTTMKTTEKYNNMEIASRLSKPLASPEQQLYEYSQCATGDVHLPIFAGHANAPMEVGAALHGTRELVSLQDLRLTRPAFPLCTSSRF